MSARNPWQLLAEQRPGSLLRQLQQMQYRLERRTIHASPGGPGDAFDFPQNLSIPSTPFTVGLSGAPYTDIQKAVSDAAAIATDDNPQIVRLMPGRHRIDYILEMATNVSVIGEDIVTCIISQVSQTYVVRFNGIKNSALHNVTVENIQTSSNLIGGVDLQGVPDNIFFRFIINRIQNNGTGPIVWVNLNHTGAGLVQY